MARNLPCRSSGRTSGWSSVATESNLSAKTATVGVWIDARSRFETDQTNDTAHFLEHMIFKGTEKSTARELEEEIENMGGHLNAYTSREQTTYYAKVMDNDVPKALDILADILQNSKFDENRITRERDVILREMEEVEGQTDEVIAASGAVKHEDIVEQVKKLFTKLSTDPTTASELVAKEPAIFSGSKVRIIDDDIPLAQFAVAFNGASWTDPDSIALMVMQSMLGSWNKNAGGGKHMGSELAQRVGINEIAENMMAFNTNYKDTGLFGVYAIAKFRKMNLLAAWFVKPDKFTLNIVINCFCKLNRVDLGFSILGNLLKLGYEPNITTFNTLINGLCVNAKIALAVKFLDEIVENGFQPNFITSSTIITGLCKIGNTSVAILLLRKMEEIGGCEPGLVEYSTVIDSLCKDRLVTKSFKLFSEMIGKAISPNAVTYTSLIQGVSSLGEWEETTTLLNEMVVTDQTLLKFTQQSSCSSGKAKQSLQQQPIVSKHKNHVCIVKASILADALCKEGKAKEAQDVVELMIQRGVVPDVVTYNAVMDGYCLCGQVDEARKMLDVIVSRRCAPSLFTYNILINGRLRDALLLFNEMQVHGQIPNLLTYSVLLDGLCKNQHLDEALALFKKLENAGLAPDIVIYSNLIEGMCLGGKLDDARKAT
ncbi:hypothetical protein ACSBR2_041792 [Camellia fascicularis]